MSDEITRTTIDRLRNPFDLSGKTVVMTGGTGVLGGEMACALAAVHAHVVILARDPGRADNVLRRIDDIADRQGRVVVIPADVLDKASLLAAAAQVRAEFGDVYALINAAGGNQPGATTQPDQSFFDLPEESLRQVFDLNLLGTLLPSQVFGRGMVAADAGVILNISSMASFSPLTRIVAYSAAKSAVNNFTQWLAVHMAQEYSHHIRVNAIAPGFFLTEQNRFLLTDEQSGEFTERGRTIVGHTPMARFGAPDDLLGAMLWLLSPLSSFVTGIVVPVDGGFSAFSGV